ncbi:MAG TPA: glycosyltransferase [Actinomycetota bacterium]|jgi:glycosyltransferase involved in cell wall biosynthesis
MRTSDAQNSHVEPRAGRRPVVLMVSAIGARAHQASVARVHTFRDGLTRRGWTVVPVGLEDPPPRFLSVRSPIRVSSRLVEPFHRLGMEGEVNPRQGLAVSRLLRSRGLRADAAIVTVPPHSLLWVARSLASRLPVVVDYRDDLSATMRPTPLARALGPLERAVARRASAITFAGSPELGARIARLSGLPPARVLQVQNGIDPADVPEGVTGGSSRPAAGGPERPLDLVYEGHVYGRLRPDALLKAVARAGPDVARLEFIGTVERRLRDGLRSLGGPGVTWNGPLARPELYERLARADAGTVCLGEGYPHETAYPAKAYEYLALGLPVIAVCPPRSAVRTLGPPGAVIWFDERDPAGLIGFLGKALTDRTLLPRTEPDPTRYDRDLGVGALDALLRETLGHRVRLDPSGS